MRGGREVLIWTAVAAAIGVPIVLAAFSPQLEWRDAIYTVAGFAGIAALGLLLIQPLLILGMLPGFTAYKARRMHHWTGGAVVLMLVIHVAGLWITSPPDMLDALLYRSPTPFSPWGVTAMWAVVGVALLAVFRRRLGMRRFRAIHMVLAVVIVTGAVVHAVLVEGSMETISKAVLCAAVAVAAVGAIAEGLRRKRRVTQ